MAYFLSLSTSDSGPTVNMTGKASDSFSWVIAWIVNDMSKGVLRLVQAVRRIIHIDPHDLELAWTEMRGRGETFWKGNLKLFLQILMSFWTPDPVTASQEFAYNQSYQTKETYRTNVIQRHVVNSSKRKLLSNIL